MALNIGTAPTEASRAFYEQPNFEEEMKKARETAVVVDLGERPLPQYLQALKSPSFFTMFPAIIKNFWEELLSLDSVPCLSRSLAYGALGGGIVTGLAFWKSRNLAAWNYGFISFFGISLISWEGCRADMARKQRQAFQVKSFLESQVNEKQERFESFLAELKAKKNQEYSNGPTPGDDEPTTSQT